MAATSTGASVRSRQRSCFYEWLNLQEQDLSELLQSLKVEEDHGVRDVLFDQLIQKSIAHFQEYADQRTHLAAEDVSPYFAPTWCTSLESSLLWLGGCRPSIFIRLVYTLSGLHVEAFIRDLLDGTQVAFEMDQHSVSGAQLKMIDDLHSRTIKDEQKLSDQMASLQETIADNPIAIIAKEANLSSAGESGVQADEALDEHKKSMGVLLQEADNLRIKTLKELISILTPLQAIEFLISGKKLHLCVRHWGQRQDLMHA